MSEVEQLAQEQFNTFRDRLCEIISEIAEEHRTAFIQGYAKGETDEKFRTKQVIKYDYNNEVVKEYTTLQERIAELEKEISILLSCKNCPNNKGGYICQKEYEDKCLSQKIQYIKELKEENIELKEEIKKWKDEWQEQAQKENDESYARTLQTIQLNTAKEIIKDFLSLGIFGIFKGTTAEVIVDRAEQYLKEGK